MMDVRVVNYVTQQGISPNWLDDYTHMRTQVFSSNGEEFTVYVREMKAGETVTLGSNFTNKDAVNYFAAAVKKPAETTEPVTTAAGTETTAEPVTTAESTTQPETTAAPKFAGDADCSGIVDVADAVLIARYNAEDRNAVITDQGRRNADCDGVPGIDGSDVTTVLLFIARIIEDFPA